jgi:hypothetical protein
VYNNVRQEFEENQSEGLKACIRINDHLIINKLLHLITTAI